MKKVIILFILSSFLLGEELFTDSKDGVFDVSNYLSQAYDFLPLPSIITEPAVGYGAAVGLLDFHDELAGSQSSTGRNIPPSVSGIILLTTENGTKGAGGFHMGFWKEDTIRSSSVALYYDLNINLYANDATALNMNGVGTYFYQSLKFRIGDSNLFLGGNFIYTNIDTTFTDNTGLSSLLNGTNANTAVALLADYDSRDNTFSPNSGMLLNAQTSFFRKKLGGDEDFNRYKLQLRWQFKPRWSALVFGGIAKVFGDDPLNPFINTSFSDAPNRYTKGIGFRYEIARKYGLRMGIDVASSQEDTAVYIPFGTAWAGI